MGSLAAKIFAPIVHAIYSVFQFLASLLNSVFSWFETIVLQLWNGLKTFAFEFVYFFYDIFLSIFEGIVNSIPVPSSWSSVSNPLATLPGQAIYLLNALGVIESILIIGGAFGVRWLINLIPAALTRV